MLKFCVLGSGISYTLSPIIHRTVFSELGIDATYGIEDIPPEKLDKNIPRLRETYDGFNVTKPHKIAIVAYLDAAACLGAVNTVKRSDGWTGFNTDVYGFFADLHALTGDIKGRRTLVLGAGGAAEAVVAALTEAGADVTVLNRTASKATALAARFGVKATDSPRNQKPELIVNCTSVNSGSPIPSGLDMSELAFGYDLVYSPLHTEFMRDCEKCGAATSNGLGMLVRQAICADEIFLGKQLDEPELYNAVMRELGKRQ